MQFSSGVEQWRTMVADIVPPQYVDKVLWIINGESGGDPNAVGDRGVSIGLLQIQNNEAFAGRPTTAQLLDPRFNIQYAASSLGINNGNFAAWGEGVLHQGRVFGALGNHPFPDVGSIVSDPIGAIGDVTSGAADVVGGIIKKITGVDPSGAAGVVGKIPGVGAVGNAISATQGVIDSTASGLTWLLTPEHWYRIFFLLAGGIMAVTGAFMYIRGDAVKSDVSSFGKAVAIA